MGIPTTDNLFKEKERVILPLTKRLNSLEKMTGVITSDKNGLCIQRTVSGWLYRVTWQQFGVYRFAWFEESQLKREVLHSQCPMCKCSPNAEKEDDEEDEII